MELGLLVSGHLGFSVFQKLVQEYKINFILTDKGSNDIIEYCELNNFPLFIGNPRNGNVFKKIPGIKCDLLVSVNYLFLIETDLIKLPQKMAINFHGSLLPKYRGRTPHVWAIINNEIETGITAHIIDTDCDTGDILFQKRVAIEPDQTGADILNIFADIYPCFVNYVLSCVLKDDYCLIPQNNNQATYFGKRTELDGEINWGWHKERIKNWIRAQSKPYPGAFTHYHGEIVKIQKIRFSNFGFNYNDSNGKIIKIENGNPIVKTPNGSIEILEYESKITIEANNVFD